MIKFFLVSLSIALLFSCTNKPVNGIADINIADSHPRLFMSSDDLNEMRANITAGNEPWTSAWETLREQSESYMDADWMPEPYFGDNSMEYYKTLMRDGSAARDLAICYFASGEERYAAKATLILMTWLPDGELPGKYFDPEINYPNLGMLAGRSLLPYLYAYDLIEPTGILPDWFAPRLEKWLRGRQEHILEGARRWADNDYFDKQWYQNHMVGEMAGLMAIGITLRDEQLVHYVIDSEKNERNVLDIIQGIIFMDGDEPYYREPEKKPVQKGEIFDRYRHYEIGGHWGDYKTLPNRGLQYCGLSTTLLLSIAEMGRLNGIDLYSYTAPTGENLTLPLLFYSDFYITKDASIKGGFYAGEDSRINLNDQTCWTLWEVAAKRYRGENKFREVLSANRNDGRISLHVLGPVGLTHCVVVQ